MTNFRPKRFLTVGLGLLCGLGVACQSVAPVPQKPLNATRSASVIEPALEPTGTWIIELNPSARLETQIVSQFETLQLNIKGRLKANGTVFYLLQSVENRSVDSIRVQEALRQLPGVAHANANMRFELPMFNDLRPRASAVDGWWRQDTGVEKAWQYAIGTGATAAYIDTGFTDRHPELNERLRIVDGANQTELGSGNRRDITLPQGDHGTASLLVGFAERDNHIPSVGVAPNAEVMPFVASNIWEVARALQAALATGPDVVGMNFAFPLYPEWEKFDEYAQYNVLKSVFADNGRGAKIPIVVPAHNYGEPVDRGVRQWIPVSWSQEFEDILPVGGIQINGQKKIAAWFSEDLVTGINARGSNYGPDFIWAPALHLDIAGTDPDSLKPGSMSGTSAACPFVTASVALIKSRFPGVSARRLKQVLRLTGEPVSATALLQNPTATVPLIQVDRAIEALIYERDQRPADFQAQRYVGRLERETVDPVVPFVLHTDSGVFQLLPTRVDMRNNQLPYVPGQRVEVYGWPQQGEGNGNALELLSIRACAENCL